MAHRPSGPRQKHGPPAASAGSSRTHAPPPPAPTRDEAFSQIFGRRNTHHVPAANAAAAHHQQQAAGGAHGAFNPAYAASSSSSAAAYPAYPPAQAPAPYPQQAGGAYPTPHRVEGRYDQFAQSAGVGLPPGAEGAAGAAAPGGGAYGSYGYPPQGPYGPRPPPQPPSAHAYGQPQPQPHPQQGPYGQPASYYPAPQDARSRRTSSIGPLSQAPPPPHPASTSAYSLHAPSLAPSSSSAVPPLPPHHSVVQGGGGAQVERRPTQGSMRSFASSTATGGQAEWSEPTHAYPMPLASHPQQQGYYPTSRNGSLAAPSPAAPLAAVGSASGLTPAQEYQAQVALPLSSRSASPAPSSTSGASHPPSYATSSSSGARPFPPSNSPSSFASSRAQAQHARGGPAPTAEPTGLAALQLPAFESFGTADGGFNWDGGASASRRVSRETDDEELVLAGAGAAGGASAMGGMVTPRPGALDDSELGYLAAGSSAPGTHAAAAPLADYVLGSGGGGAALDRVQSSASSVYSVDNYYSGAGGPHSGPASVGSRYSAAPSVRSGHTRTPSESSSRSVGGFGDGGGGGRGGFAPLARIDTTSSNYYASDARSLASPSSGVVDFPRPAGHRSHASNGRDSVDSSRSQPYGGQAGGAYGPYSPGTSYANRSTSFSSQHSASRDAAVASLRNGPGSIRSVGGGSGGGSGGGPNFPPPSSYNFPSPGGSTRTTATSGGGGSIVRAARRPVRIYPALLSRVADAFRSGLTLTERVKDGLAYKDAFDGREAVDLLCALLDTDNRNLALLLGRALDWQKFFHDVTYDHRLRDSAAELYQFRRRVIVPNAPFAAALAAGAAPDGGMSTPPSASAHGLVSDDGAGSIAASLASTALTTAPSSSGGERSSISSLPTTAGVHAASSLPTSPSSVLDQSLQLQQQQAAAAAGAADGGADDLPSGVFTLLSACYSPTCSSTSLCYSISCPLRIEQAKKLNMKPQPGLRKVASVESLKDDDDADGADGGPGLWANGVSQAVLDSVGDEERKRQEAINELIFTERDFVKDMEYLRDFWVKPLRSNDVIQPPERRDAFATQVFWNVSTILANNSSLADALTKRQRSQPVVESVGDIFLDRVPLFQPFVDYGGHQAYGKHEFEKEKLDNPDFVRFVDEVERKPESRKIELNGFLTKPTTRLGRYPLLLKAILKATPEGNPDQQWIPQVIELLNGWLDKVNTAAGKTQSRMDLAQLDSQLRRAESQELRLDDESRELVHKGQLKRRGGTQSESADLEVYLLDNVLVLARYKAVSKTESELRLYKRPIPLELMTMVTPDEQYNLTKYGIRPKALLNRTATGKSSGGGTASSAAAKPEKEGKHGYSITFHYLGRRGYTLTLWHESHVQRKKWLETIDKQQQLVRERNRRIELHPLEPSLVGPFKVNCAVPYMGGDKIIYGTDDGVYFSNLAEPDKKPALVVSLLDVTQVEVLEHPFPLLIVLAERSVQTFPLESLSLQDPTAALKRGKRISSHTTFFKAGLCVGRQLVCIVKSSPLSTTIKTMDPVEAPAGKKQQGGAAFSKLKPNRNETLRVFKEFYIPTESSSIHFLKTRLCVGCTKGFEIVDLETLDTQGLLDPADPNLDLVHKRDNQRPVRPIAIYRVERDFLLCYDEFAFYVDKNGWRVGGPRNRKDVRWKLTWEGLPTSFALHYPWVMAFDPNFVEIWNVNTGVFTQVIQGSNIRLLFADTPPTTAHSPASLQQQHMQQQPRMAFRPPPPQQQQQGYYPPYGQQGNGYGAPPPGMQPRPGMMRPPPPHGMQSPYAGQPPPPLQQQMRLPPPPPRNARSKIVFSIDEKVVEVRLAA